MKTLALAIISAGILLASSSFAKPEESTYFVLQPSYPKPPLASAKALLIKDGMTLKQIVAKLGLGWVGGGPTGYGGPQPGVLVIEWIFDDGRILNALPDDVNAPEILTFKGAHGAKRLWWSR